MFNFKTGVLKFIIDSAEIYRNTEAVGQMDPFVTIAYKSLNENETKLKTSVV